MGIKFNIAIHSLLLALFILGSCTSSNKQQATENEVDALPYDESFMEIEEEGVIYKIPSPIDIFVFLDANKAPFLKENMHNPSRHQDYLSRKSWALNLGIYSADLAYSAVYGDIQHALLYFNAAKILASKLGLHEGYGEQMALRIDQNLNNLDSLIDITTDSYYQARQFLEDQEMTELMGIMVAGGWIESFFLAIKSVPNAQLNHPIVERIVDQQLLLENLIAQLKKYDSDKAVAEIIKQLEELQAVFDILYFNEPDTPITREQFIQIANKVTDLRESFIK
ncbi:MAG: hypothetical protein AB7S69_02440 [Salinivirgaceae bacterium]|jgi:hypothetical protein